MSGRLARTRRLLAVQGQRDQLSEWQLHELWSQLAVLDERCHSLMRFLEQKSAFSGMFSDEAFRELYTSDVDFKHLEKYDVDRLTKVLAEKINRRLAKEVIKDILVAEFTFVPARENWRTGKSYWRNHGLARRKLGSQHFEACGRRIELRQKLRMADK